MEKSYHTSNLEGPVIRSPSTNELQRDMMLFKLLLNKSDGKLYNTVKSIYQSSESCVGINGYLLHQNADSIVREADSIVREADSIVRVADSIVRNTDSIVRVADSIVRNAASIVREADSIVRGADSIVRNAASIVRYADSIVREADGSDNSDHVIDFTLQNKTLFNQSQNPYLIPLFSMSAWLMCDR
ncbi:Hypothetical predicted protein [Mytilus galloprovincialis]|uniref:Uncharacterized protein n=1 Tax=Mytilus galloprovincialis TaxID=29158 RepID=A0A8B6E0Z5_MYTGA|nr:Hypothetical predicted protein [Mytilus galloprovincialis]